MKCFLNQSLLSQWKKSLGQEVEITILTLLDYHCLLNVEILIGYPINGTCFFFFLFFQKKVLRDTKQTWAITLEQQFFDIFFPQHLDGFHYFRGVASRILHAGMACLYQSPVLFINFFLEICIVVSERFGRQWMNTLARFCWDPMLAELL